MRYRLKRLKRLLWLEWTSRRRRPPFASLGDECESYLNGTYADHLVRRDRPVPLWGVLNVFAHGDLARIAAIASQPEGSRPARPQQRLAQARVALAVELLGLVGSDPDALSSLQLAVLVPLELGLMQERGGPIGPIDVVQRARNALEGAHF